MGNELIAENVARESSSFDWIRFYDLEELKTKIKEPVFEASFMWIQTTGSSFPNFIPYDNAVTSGDTLFYSESMN